MTSEQAQEYVDMIRAGATVMDVVTTESSADQIAQIMQANGAHHIERVRKHL